MRRISLATLLLATLLHSTLYGQRTTRHASRRPVNSLQLLVKKQLDHRQGYLYLGVDDTIMTGINSVVVMPLTHSAFFKTSNQEDFYKNYTMLAVRAMLLKKQIC